MKAAAIALPFEHPKLAVTASLDGTGFAAQMEEVARRNGRSFVIDANADHTRERKRVAGPPIQTNPDEPGGFKRRL
jgi:hypothetical protein